MRTPKQKPSLKNKSKVALKVQAATTSFVEANTSSINLPSQVPSPQLHYGFKMATPISAVKPTLREPSNSKSERELKTPIDLEDDFNITTPITNTSVVLIVDPIEDATPVRSRKSYEKNISMQRLIANDEGSTTPTTISTPKSALKKSRVMAELMETSIDSSTSTTSSLRETNLVSPFQSKLNKSGTLRTTTTSKRRSLISYKQIKRRSTSNNPDLSAKKLRPSRGTTEECNPFKSPAPSTSKSIAKTDHSNSIICGNSTLESIDTSSFEYVSNSPNNKKTPTPTQACDSSSDDNNSFICGDSTLRSVDTSSFLFFGKKRSAKKIAVSTEKLIKKKSATPNMQSADVSITTDSVAKTPNINKTDLNISGIEILENENDVFGKKVRTYSRSPVKKSLIEETEHLETPEVPPNVIEWVSKTLSHPRPRGRPLGSTKAKVSSSSTLEVGNTSLQPTLRRDRLSQYSKYSKKSNAMSQEHTTPAKAVTFTNILTSIKNAAAHSSLPRPLESSKIKISLNRSLPLNSSSRSRGRPLGPSTTKRSPDRSLLLNSKLRPRGQAIGTTKAKHSGPRIVSSPPATNIEDEMLTPTLLNSITSLPRARGPTTAKLTPNSTSLQPLGSTKVTDIKPRKVGRPSLVDTPLNNTTFKANIVTPIRTSLLHSSRRRGPIGTTKAKLSPAPKHSGLRKVGRPSLVNTPDKNNTFKAEIVTPSPQRRPIGTTKAKLSPATKHSGLRKVGRPSLVNTPAKNNTFIAEIVTPSPQGRAIGTTKAKLSPAPKLSGLRRVGRPSLVNTPAKNNTFRGEIVTPSPQGRPIGITKAKLSPARQHSGARKVGRPSRVSSSAKYVIFKADIVTPTRNASTTLPRPVGRPSGTTKPKHDVLTPNRSVPLLSNLPRLRERPSRPTKVPEPEKVGRPREDHNNSAPEICLKEAISPIKIFQNDCSNSQKKTKHITPAKHITFKDDVLTPIRKPLHSSTPLPPKINVKNKTSAVSPNKSDANESVGNNVSEDKALPRKSVNESSKADNSNIDDNNAIDSSRTRQNKSKERESKYTPIKGRTSYTENYIKFAIASKLEEKTLELNENHGLPEENSNQLHVDLCEDVSVEKSREIKKKNSLENNETPTQISSPLKQTEATDVLKDQDNNKSNQTSSNMTSADRKTSPSQKVKQNEVGVGNFESNTAMKVKKRSELDFLNEYNVSITQKKMDTQRKKDKTVSKSPSPIGAKSLPPQKMKQRDIVKDNVDAVKGRSTKRKIRNELDFLNEYNASILLKKMDTQRKGNLKIINVEDTMDIKRTRSNAKLLPQKVTRRAVNRRAQNKVGDAPTKTKKRNEFDLLIEYNENLTLRTLDTRYHKRQRENKQMRNNILIDEKRPSRKIKQNVDTNKNQTKVRATRSKINIDEAIEGSSEIGGKNKTSGIEGKVPLKRSKQIEVKNDISMLQTRSKRKLLDNNLKVSTVKRRKVII